MDPNLNVWPQPPEKIVTARLELRARKLEDAPQCFALINASREHLKPWMPWEETTKSETDSVDYFKLAISWWNSRTTFDFSIFLKNSSENSNIMIGSVGLHSLTWEKRTGEVGYWLGKDYEKKGYITEAVQELEKIAFTLGLHRLKIVCDRLNLRSQKIAHRLGYQLESIEIDEAYQGHQYRDTIRFAKLLNPKIDGYITENFPRGFGLKKVSPEVFGKMVYNLMPLISKEEFTIIDQKILEVPKKVSERFNKGLQLFYLLYHEDKIAGWSYGFQDSIESFCMANSAILPQYRGRKLYSRIVEQVLLDCKNLGFQRVLSQHNMTNSLVIATKLRRGFEITGTSLNLFAGTMVSLTYYTNSLRREILDFRCGHAKPNRKVKQALKL